MSFFYNFFLIKYGNVSPFQQIISILNTIILEHPEGNTCWQIKKVKCRHFVINPIRRSLHTSVLHFLECLKKGYELNSSKIKNPKKFYISSKIPCNFIGFISKHTVICKINFQFSESLQNYFFKYLMKDIIILTSFDKM